MSLLNNVLDNIDSVSEEIYRWCNNYNKLHALNVISAPYNNCSIFLEGVLNIIYKKGKVLYITNEDEENIKFLQEIKKKTSFREYYYFRNKSGNNNEKKLVFCNHENSKYIEEEFDLIIYDDISSYSEYTTEDIRAAIYSKKSLKYVVYSIEEVLDYGDIIEYPIKIKNTPFVEPRIINTRIDINKDIPYVMYEYLTWFAKSNKNVVIYIPDKEKKSLVFEYLKALDDTISSLVVDIEADNKKLLNRFKIKDICTIAITNSMNNIPKDMNDLNIVVYFADHITLDYKKLIFICGKAVMTKGVKGSEVIFLSNTITYNMEKAKDITRTFNKLAWEKGLLSI